MTFMMSNNFYNFNKSNENLIAQRGGIASIIGIITTIYTAACIAISYNGTRITPCVPNHKVVLHMQKWCISYLFVI